MKRVLLTGATGFIGRHAIARLLQRGYEIHATCTRPPDTSQHGVKWHLVDLLDQLQSTALFADIRPTHFLHLSWYAVPGSYWNAIDNFYWVQSSLGLLDAFAKNGGRRAVLAGTCAEYDWRYGYCVENVTPCNPSTVYGECKLALQRLSKSYCTKSDVSMAWGRPFFLFGPHEHPERLVASVIRSFLKGEEARCTHGEQIRDFMYVLDVADAFVSILESHVEGPINIASGEPIRIRDLLGQLSEMLNSQHLLGLGKHPAPDNEPNTLLADVSRLTLEAKWLPNYSIETALSDTIHWWRDSL